MGKEIYLYRCKACDVVMLSYSDMVCLRCYQPMVRKKRVC